VSDTRDGKAVTRDFAWIEREYGREKWPAILKHIDALRQDGETSLSRMVTAVTRAEFGNPTLDPRRLCLEQRVVDVPGSFGWYGAYAMIAELVVAATRPDTGAVIDLGAGWGRTLLDVWLRGGPRDAPYFALEFTAAGQQCAAALGALEPGLDLRTGFFDFTRPDYSILPRDLSHAVIVTVSSVHQVPLLEEAAYREILGVAPEIDCLHFEQLGWQMDSADPDDPARAYAIKNDYNRNFWPILSSLEKSGDIEFVAVETDLVGLRSDYPLSLVHWRRRA